MIAANFCQANAAIQNSGVLEESAYPATSDSIKRVESGLSPAISVVGHPTRWTIAERLKKYNVPGVSIAIICGGRIEWAKAYGKYGSNIDRPVTVSTLFQAASISKPVAAAGALTLCQDGLLDLNDDVSAKLRGWAIEPNELVKNDPVTLQRLLSHTAGMTVHGFAGYSMDSELPTTIGILNGDGNSRAVLVDARPGSKWRYSGGGYVVAQLLMTEVSNSNFSTLMKKRILVPAGMSNSTFVQPLPEKMRADAAIAHRVNGKPVDGLWHAYPEMSAAGLWTTPSDLAKFFVAIRASYRNEPNSILSTQYAKRMCTSVMNDYGLGVSVTQFGDETMISHGGANEGFRCHAVMHLESGDGAIVMTNSDNGTGLAYEIVRSIAREYEWPSWQATRKTPIKIDKGQLGKYVGHFDMRFGRLATIRMGQGNLILSSAKLGKLELWPESDESFFAVESSAQSMKFIFDDSGDVTAIKLGRRTFSKID